MVDCGCDAYVSMRVCVHDSMISIEKMAMAVISVAVSLSSITSRLGSYSKQKTGVVRTAMVLAV